MLRETRIMPSTVIRSFHYDAEKNTLKVIFISGTVYEYLQVPEAIYLEMKNSFSKGEFLNKHIKGNYDFRKIK